jgi:hypothetical protein
VSFSTGSLVIEVRLQGEGGEPKCAADIGISFPLSTGNTSYSLLCYIDPYGDTVFNGLQMDVFLSEWERVRDMAETPEQVEAWSSVRDFARKCNEEAHLYLRFRGD